MNEKEFIFNKCKRIVNIAITRRMIKDNIIQIVLLCFQFIFIPMINDKVCIIICTFFAWVQAMMILFNINCIIKCRSLIIAKIRKEIECENIVLEKGSIYIKSEIIKEMDDIIK